MAVKGMIRWTQDEQLTITKGVVTQLAPGESLSTTHVLEAQKALPPDRHRDKQSLYASLTRQRVALAEFRRAYPNWTPPAEEPKSEEPESPPEPQAAAPTAEPRREEVQYRLPNFLAPPPAPTRLGLDPAFAPALVTVVEGIVRAIGEAQAGHMNAFGANLVSSLSGAIVDGVSKGVRDVMWDMRFHLGAPKDWKPREEPQQQEPEEQSALPEKFLKPKAVVIGLRGVQMMEVQRRVHGVELRFLNADTASNVIEEVSKNADTTFIMTKFIGHRIDNHVKGAKKLLRCNGGVSDLAMMIRNTYVNHPAVQAQATARA